MTKVTGSHNQELQQQLHTKKSPTTFNGIAIFQLVKTHHCANKTIDWVWNKKSSETCTADLYIPPSGLHVQYIIFSTIVCLSIQVLGPSAVTTRLLSFPTSLWEALTVRGSETNIFLMLVLILLFLILLQWEVITLPPINWYAHCMFKSIQLLLY